MNDGLTTGLFSLTAETHSTTRTVYSHDLLTLISYGRCLHQMAFTKPDLSIRDIEGSLLATMDPFSNGWKWHADEPSATTTTTDPFNHLGQRNLI